MTRALVLLSGGTDSAVALSIARSTCEKVTAIGFAYGQKSEPELKAAARVAKYYDVQYSFYPLPRSIFSGILLQGHDEMPEGHLRDLKPHGTSPVEVPFRNGIFLSIAVSFAVILECDQIWHGIHAEHGTDWAYPDNSPEFLGALAASIWIGSANRVRLVSPFLHITKGEVVEQGRQWGTPFELTYSCYAGATPPCGKCIACNARKEAFAYASFPDPALRNTDEVTEGYYCPTCQHWFPSEDHRCIVPAVTT